MAQTKCVPVDDLEPHEFSRELYRQETPSSRFTHDIAESGLENPIIGCRSSETVEIIDGVRRWLAVKELNWDEVLVDIREYEDEEAKKEAILRHNDDRDETFYQKMRVALNYEDTVAPRLKERMKRGESVEEMAPEEDPAQNFAEGENTTALELAADRVGWSDETLRKAKKVWNLAQEEGVEWAERAIEAINDGDKSIHSAYERYEKWKRQQELSTPVEWDDYMRAANRPLIKRCEWTIKDELEEKVSEDNDWREQVATLYNILDEQTGQTDLSGSEYIFAYRLEKEGYADYDSEEAPESFSDREPTKEELREQYWDEGMSIGQIAVLYGVNTRLVEYWMWKKDVPKKYEDVSTFTRRHLDVSYQISEEGSNSELEVVDNTKDWDESEAWTSEDELDGVTDWTGGLDD